MSEPPRAQVGITQSVGGHGQRVGEGGFALLGWDSMLSCTRMLLVPGYRDFRPGLSYPLLPWLCSSDAARGMS